MGPHGIQQKEKPKAFIWEGITNPRHQHEFVSGKQLFREGLGGPGEHQVEGKPAMCLVTKEVSSILGCMRKSCQHVEEVEVVLPLFSALVRPHLVYCV